jgi:hypothetical protein
VTQIALYVEGGGETANQKAELRLGFDGLLKSVKSKAQTKRLRWTLVCAGGRQAAYEAFANAVRTNPDTINVLLVDSEDPVASETGDPARDAAVRVTHLRQRDGWDLSATRPERVHLMVRCMEAWIVADPDALADYYGQGFAPNILPVRPNLEDEPKPDVYDKLARATRDTKKGEYGKIKHASQLLQRIDPAKVSRRCPRFTDLLRSLDQIVEAA